ncbi:UDP-3-O-acyl-N-acetylglucosamine deacetylase [Stella sp.]|uniref:UDP-3-O-acyl-N-acetylglucosamine deacetylase n=1 Tax=Stella sp. TaxID=2912054 RepID=UPI0035B01248
MRPSACPALRRTIKSAIHCTGVGLHSGQRTVLRLLPAAAGTGIVFRRIDLAGAPEVRALWDRAVESPLCTTLVEDGVVVSTVEHLMAALAGMEIDDVVVEIDGPEVPIMDGSAAPFVFLIECAGAVELAAPRRAIRILKEVRVGDARAWASLRPGPVPSFRFEIDFPHPVIARQSYAVTLHNGAFKNEVSRARTFGFLHEVDKLRELGLARGGSLDNAIVVADDGILNEDGLRYTDEFVRHKIVDSIGDLYLAGGPIIGRFEGHRSSHALSARLLRTVMTDPSAWAADDVAEGIMTPAWESGPLAATA